MICRCRRADGRGTIENMSSWMQVGRRSLEPEMMDDPALSHERHVAALRGLERINRWSGSVGIVWAAIRELVRGLGGESLRVPDVGGTGALTGPATVGQPLRVLDLATGAGDVPIGLARRARRAGVLLEIEACDASPTALEYARQRAARAGADVRFFLLDVLGGDFPAGYDVVVSSLFLHHLSEEAAVLLLRKMAAAARRLVVVNDLLRSRRGLALAYLAPRLLTTSKVVHVDAVRSVRAAFKLDEVHTLAGQAGLGGVVLWRCWPQRYALVWRRHA